MSTPKEEKVPAAPPVDPLEIAAYRYYYKPMAIFFNAFHLRAFVSAAIEWQGNVLDIGCSDGACGVMLMEAVGAPKQLTGIDLSANAIAAASPAAKAVYNEMICANAVELPFDDESFGSLVSNASMLSIDPGLEQALKETYRVLKPGGAFYATVCTDQYEQHYWITKLLHAVGARKLARRYMDKMNRRMQQAHLYTPERWQELFRGAGFEVQETFGFLPLRLTPLWSFLAWTPMRIHGVLKLIPWPGLHRFVSRFYQARFAPLYRETPPKCPPEECGYIFLKLTKPS